MKKLRLDFKNRIVSIVSDKKTVIAYMDDNLEKKDFLTFFPDETAGECTDNVTFDFENSRICLKQPVEHIEDADTPGSAYRCVKRIPTDSICERRQHILKIIGWKDS